MLAVFYLNADGHFVLTFIEGIKNTYQIDDCDRRQLERILKNFEKKGIPVLCSVDISESPSMKSMGYTNLNLSYMAI